MEAIKRYTEREMEILKAKIKIADAIESLIKGNDFELKEAVAPNLNTRIQIHENVQKGLKIIMKLEILESDEP